MSRFASTLLVCPTLNPGAEFDNWLKAYSHQKDKPASALIIDSSSTDGSIDAAKDYGFQIEVIARETFSHGGTRQKVVEGAGAFGYLIFLTQDAILRGDLALTELMTAFEDPDVAAVYGRQLPRENAGEIETHARLYSYPDQSSIRSIKDIETQGMKAAFLSNSFAAYRRDALLQVGGFHADVIFGEDMHAAARLLKVGYKIAYAADACVYHSHQYSVVQEMRRYFDMGVLHAREPWLRQELGSAEGEGMKFVVSELGFLARHAFWKIPEGLLRTAVKYAGFRLGLIERHIPLNIKKKLTMNPAYFKSN